MCAIFTVDHATFSDGIMKQIKDDAVRNPDGFSLLLYDRQKHATVIRTMDIAVIEAVLRNSEWTRMFLHLRKATKGTVHVRNTHGWETRGIYYMQNGRIDKEKAKALDVDTMMIGEWLRTGITHALKNLFAESYANVFLIDTVQHYYVMHRSSVGSLHTDGKGNYSTSSVEGINIVVAEYSQAGHAIKVDAPAVTAITATDGYTYRDHKSSYNYRQQPPYTGWYSIYNPNGPNYIPPEERRWDSATNSYRRATADELMQEQAALPAAAGGCAATDPKTSNGTTSKECGPSGTDTSGSTAIRTVPHTTDVTPRTNTEEVAEVRQKKFTPPTADDIVSTVMGVDPAGKKTLNCVLRDGTVIRRRRPDTPSMADLADAAAMASGEGV